MSRIIVQGTVDQILELFVFLLVSPSLQVVCDNPRRFTSIVLILFINYHSHIMFLQYCFLIRISPLIFYIPIYQSCNPLSNVKRQQARTTVELLRFPKPGDVMTAMFRRSCALDCTGLKTCNSSKVLRRVDSQTCLNSLPNGHALCQASLPLSYSESFSTVLVLPCLGRSFTTSKSLCFASRSRDKK